MQSLVLGNGESRGSLDISKVSCTKYGCNAIHRDYVVDHLICVDTRMVDEALKNPTTVNLFVGTTFTLTVEDAATGCIGTSTVSRILHAYVTTGPVMRVQSSGSNASIEFIPSTIQNRYNWLIGAQQNISDAFEITPSTATNGTTFSNPAVLVKSDGKVGIGTVSPTTLLSVGGAGSASAASGITFGGDSEANLYRISTARLQTDGSLTIGGQGGLATALTLNRSSTSNENGIAFNSLGSTDWYFYSPSFLYADYTIVFYTPSARVQAVNLNNMNEFGIP